MNEMKSFFISIKNGETYKNKFDRDVFMEIWSNSREGRALIQGQKQISFSM